LSACRIAFTVATASGVDLARLSARPSRVSISEAYDANREGDPDAGDPPDPPRYSGECGVEGSCAGSGSAAASFFGLEVADVLFFLVTSFFAARFAVTTSATLESLRDDPDMPPASDRRAATGEPLAFVFGDPGECAG
jgi:hypothetical protein